MYRRIDLSTYLSIYSTYQLSTHQWIYESNYVSIQLPIHLSMHLPTDEMGAGGCTQKKGDPITTRRQTEWQMSPLRKEEGWQLKKKKKKGQSFAKKATPLMRFNPDASTLP